MAPVNDEGGLIPQRSLGAQTRTHRVPGTEAMSRTPAGLARGSSRHCREGRGGFHEGRRSSPAPRSAPSTGTAALRVVSAPSTPSAHAAGKESQTAARHAGALARVTLGVQVPEETRGVGGRGAPGGPLGGARRQNLRQSNGRRLGSARWRRNEDPASPSRGRGPGGARAACGVMTSARDVRERGLRRELVKAGRRYASARRAPAAAAEGGPPSRRLPGPGSRVCGGGQCWRVGAAAPGSPPAPGPRLSSSPDSIFPGARGPSPLSQLPQPEAPFVGHTVESPECRIPGGVCGVGHTGRSLWRGDVLFGSDERRCLPRGPPPHATI